MEQTHDTEWERRLSMARHPSASHDNVIVLRGRSAQIQARRDTEVETAALLDAARELARDTGKLAAVIEEILRDREARDDALALRSVAEAK